MKPDQFHGQGGTYEVVDGERRLVEGSTLKHHEEGDTARDAKGRVTHKVDPRATPEPALPAPADGTPIASGNFTTMSEAHDA